MRFDLGAGFPVLTTKKLHLRSIIHELLWFLRGDTNVAYLHEHDVTIWDEWADEQGDLGPVYGAQWRAWRTADGGHVDQIQNALDLIRSDPNSRRIIVSAWNVGELEQDGARAVPRAVPVLRGAGPAVVPALPAQRRRVSRRAVQHCLLRVAAAHDGAADELAPGELVWTGGDCHLYSNHLEQVEQQLTREPLPLPRLVIKRRPASLFDYRFEDFELVDYRAHASIKAPIAV